MKKFIVAMLLACLFLSTFGVSTGFAFDAKKLNVVTTIFPPYDFVREIAGDLVDVSMLLSPGAESHSFEPRPQDIIKIQNADVFIYVGGENDVWVDRILESMDTSNMTILALTDMVATVDEVIVEGMEHGHDHEEEAFDPDNVHDRPLVDWAGSWTSIAPLAADGSLDAYVETLLAEDESKTLDEARAERAAIWQSDIASFAIDGDTVTIGSASAPYTYEGYTLTPNDHGTSVWYQFKIAAPHDALPAYLVFSDHSTGGEAHEETQGEHEAHLAHTHLRFGDDGFESLLEAESWSPFYVATGATTDEVLGVLLGHSHSEETEMDEHVWTSPANAKAIVDALSGILSTLDATNAETYAAHAAAYCAELDSLDAAFCAVMDSAARTTLLFGDRFPFRYLADAYGLTYFAAFPGCANETEASASTIAFLIDKMAEENLPAVFTIEFSNGKIADVIAESSGAQRLELHSCHNVSKQDFDAGIGYLDLMYRNVDQLKEALK